MVHFEWDREKELLNVQKHGVNFKTAMLAFEDPRRWITVDDRHSWGEIRFFCFGKVDESVLTVRFTYQGEAIRIIGAGYWRKGRKFYEEKESKRGYL